MLRWKMIVFGSYPELFYDFSNWVHTPQLLLVSKSRTLVTRCCDWDFLFISNHFNNRNVGDYGKSDLIIRK